MLKPKIETYAPPTGVQLRYIQAVKPGGMDLLAKLDRLKLRLITATPLKPPPKRHKRNA